LPDRLPTQALFSGGSPMTDVAYLCHNCGSVHEVELIRDNLILDLRTAASYELSGHRGILGLRTRFRRWRMTWRLAQILWPAYSHRAGLAQGRRLEHGGPRPDLIALSLAERQQVPALRPGQPGHSRYAADWPASASTSPPRCPPRP
jgi:hypothetical protein